MRHLDLLLVLRRGVLPDPPEVVLSLSLVATRVGPRRSAGLTVAVAGAPVHERSVPFAAAERLAAALEQLGFPPRLPEVRAAIDSSDVSTHLLLRVAREGAHATLDLHLLASGYEGPDAPALRAALAGLLDLADVRDRTVRFDLTGL